MRRFMFCGALVEAFLMSAVVSLAGPTYQMMIFDGGDQTLWDVNPATAAMTKVWKSSDSVLTSVAIQPTTQQWFGLDFSSPDRLTSINPLTGATALIGPTNQTNTLNLVAQAGTGALFASGNSNFSGPLHSINPSTGAATAIGSNLSSPFGLGFDKNGVLYQATGQSLTTINTVTGAVLTSIPMTYTSLPVSIVLASALGFDPLTNQVYYAVEGFINGGPHAIELYTLNTSTGVATPVGAMPGLNSVDSIVFQQTSVPEPSTWVLAGIGLVALGVIQVGRHVRG